MELSRSQVKWDIFKTCLTPFIFRTDFNYRTTTTTNIKNKMKHEFLQQDYEWDYFDCEDYAWILKALVHSDRVNGIGVVFGMYTTGTGEKVLHYWNVYLTKDGAMQADPMLKTTFKKSDIHKPYCVII